MLLVRRGSTEAEAIAVASAVPLFYLELLALWEFLPELYGQGEEDERVHGNRATKRIPFPCLSGSNVLTHKTILRLGQRLAHMPVHRPARSAVRSDGLEKTGRLRQTRRSTLGQAQVGAKREERA